MRTIYHFGVGPDLNELMAEKTLKDVKKVFVDPCIPETIIKENLVCKQSGFEEYIGQELVKDLMFPGSFEIGKIYCSRMIEHINIAQLRYLTLPLLSNLVNVGMELELIYPNIFRVANSLNDYSLYNHHLCNIEAIAFGEHKVILTDDLVMSFFNADTMKIEIKKCTLDNKDFYSKAIIKPIDTPILVERTVNESYYISPKEDPMGFSDELWSISNAVKEGEIDSDTLFYSFHVPKELSHTRFLNACKKYPTFESFEFMKQLIEGEGHFQLTNDSYLYNMVHPIDQVVTFKYVK